MLEFFERNLIIGQFTSNFGQHLDIYDCRSRIFLFMVFESSGIIKSIYFKFRSGLFL